MTANFPASGSRPAVKMTWYDGGLTPPKPVEIGDAELNKGGGVLYIGTKGKLMHDTYGYNPRLLPQSLHDSVGTPKQTYERVRTSHEMNWIDAIRGTQKTTSPFEYSAKLTEIMLLGVVALSVANLLYAHMASIRPGVAWLAVVVSADNVANGIAGTAFIAFMSSFDNVPVSLFLRDARTDMLPIRMWQDLEGKLDVTIAAVSGVLIVFTIALMVLMERVAGLSRRLR